MEFTCEHSGFWGLGENKYPNSEEGTFLQRYWKPLAETVPACVFFGVERKRKGLGTTFVKSLESSQASAVTSAMRAGQFWSLATAFGLHNIRSLCYLSEKAWWGTANYQCFQKQQDLFLYGHQGHKFIPLKCDIRMFGVLWEDSVLEALELNRST